ncbi:hypothetical protein GCM10025868_26130 [Angustibacter aerolatus]|uniref:Aminotransferase class III-fold pyridoxal phosphate-dependent enzyme n=1 Tax=Angustibacter aerolatus TaxID=1162965 RepID=A0ABQ6JIX9_9ACTN|nr:hypothetical protein GCM10025868_26130 [Angustibacter aerolatus]
MNTNVGHQHPAVVRGIQEQAARLCTIAPQHAVDVRSEAARLVTEHAPDGLSKVFFTNAGAEAIENAVRMARLHTGRRKVLSRYRSTTATRRRRSTSPATRGAGRTTRAPRGSCTSSGPTSTARRSTRRPRRRSAPARSSTSSR